MAVTVGELKTALEKLDGVSFSSREEFENALYGPFSASLVLQAGMPGKSYRDLADILIAKKWAIWDRSTSSILLRFPPEPEIEKALNLVKETSVEQDSKKVVKETLVSGQSNWNVAGESQLTYREIALLVHLHTYKVDRNNMGFASLIVKRLVEYVNLADPVSQEERQSVLKNIAAGKTQAVASILNDDYKTAGNIIDEIMDAHRYLNANDFVYRLTDSGKILMEDHPDSMFELYNE